MTEPIAPSNEELKKNLLFHPTQISTNDAYKSVKSFDDPDLNIPANLLKDIFLSNFDEPSFIQGEALPRITQRPYKSLLAQSQNGTGKTLAFVLGMLARIDPNVQNLQAICICATRELVNQVYHDYIKKLTNNYKINTTVLIRDPPIKNEPEKAQLIITTPIQLDREIENFNLSTVRIVVIDEADYVMENATFSSFFQMLFAKLTKDMTQYLFFTATVNQQLHDIIGRYIDQDKLSTILVDKDKQYVPTNQHYYLRVASDDEKVETLKNIFNYLKSSHTFIFVNKKKYARALYEMLKESGYESQFISNELKRAERDRIIRQFKEGVLNVLICTNMVARGLDIPAARAVLNFDMPLLKDKPDMDTYMHRQGRTGRFQRNGIVINFIQSQADFEIIKNLKESFAVECTAVSKDNLEVFNEVASLTSQQIEE